MAFRGLLPFPVCAAEAPVDTAQRLGGVQVWPCHGIPVITAQKLQHEKRSKDSHEGVETPRGAARRRCLAPGAAEVSPVRC